MNVPPGYNQQSNVPPGYGTPGGYAPPSGYGQVQQSSSYMPPPQHPHGFRGATRQFFNPAAYRQPGTGAFGTASLIVSLVSMLLFCGLLSPISLVLGFAGLIGKKTHKGAALAGFIISIIQVMAWAAVFAFGFHHAIYSAKYAAQAGGPVVAAIEEYKKDHNGTVPASLDALVNEGYLPARWTTGLDDLASPVKSTVEGKEWKDFLQYGPGGSGYTAPAPARRESRRKDRDDDWLDGGDDSSHDHHGHTRAEVTAKTYSLKFIGVDNQWGTSDDQEIKQNPDEKFDLARLSGGNRDVLQKLSQTKRELAATLKDLDSKIKRYETEIPKEESRLKTQENALRKLIKDKGLENIEAVRKDSIGKERLALIGETRARLTAYSAKLRQLQDQRELVGIKVERLEGQESLARMAENKEDIAKLDLLLEEAKKTLGDADDTSAYMGESQKQKEAEDWYNDAKRNGYFDE